ncbi:MAG: UDP-N-acetylmuramate--alanine ligase [Alphaproteobacteria bacterium]|nr:UDP-N-acetylmuramate--alanine ligase [Alphaproteobacteria bacterium]
MAGQGERYFFCGIGGSGMMPLALYLSGKGAFVCGSDRSYDQGATPEKFQFLKDAGIQLFSQDGRGVTAQSGTLVVSSAVEESIPDVRAALSLGLPIVKRGALLAEVFHRVRERVAVAGTSGKSTTTGMIATMLLSCGLDPAFINGGQIRIEGEAGSKAVRVGAGAVIVSEMDESDGSIAHYNPTVSVLNNIALDHKGMDELEVLFGDFLARASRAVVANFDDQRVVSLVERRTDCDVLGFGFENADAVLTAEDFVMRPDGCSFTAVLRDREERCPVQLFVPGRHNIANALASIGAGLSLGLALEDCAKGLEAFRGIHRRMELVGTKAGVTVLDDFGHNPDKIAASLRTLKDFDGRLIVMFQPHGFGPLRLMGREIMEVFAAYLGPEDYLLMPEAYYAGGTVDRSVTAKDLIEAAQGKIAHAHWFETRAEIPAFIQRQAKAGDRVVVMGARDDTLHVFARQLLDLF